MKQTPVVFFSFRSPFSWMALERLERALPNVHDIMELVPFWEPDAVTAEALEACGATLHYSAMSKAKHLYILQDTKRLARALGLSLAWPVDVQPWWEPSHLAWLKARHCGRGRDLYKALVAARWSLGENISDPRVIGTIAASIGLDDGAMVDAVNDAAIRAEGASCLVRAYEEDVFGVPFFRCGRERFWGLDRVGFFLDAVARASDTSAAQDRAAVDEGDPMGGIPSTLRDRVGAYDTDSAGGCG